MHGRTEPRITRRDALGGLMALSLTALEGREAQAADSLVLATYGGPYERLLRSRVIEKFDATNGTSTKLELGGGVRSIQKLFASPRRSPYDIVYLNDDEAMIGESANLFEPIVPDQLPNLAQVYDVAKPPAVPLCTSALYELGCVYHAGRMSEPISWQDLWSKGITVAVPHPTNSYGLLFLLIAARMNGGSESNLGPGFAQIKKLSGYRIYRGYVDGIELFRSGEAHAGLFWKNRAVEMQDQGLPMRYSAPSDGTFGVRNGVRVPRNAPNPTGARAWANMVMSAEFQELFATAYYSPSNKTVKLSPGIAGKLTYGNDAVAKLQFPDWSLLNRAKTEIYERWDKEFT